MKSCEHKVIYWKTITDERGYPLYRLTCACCGADLGSESYVPYEKEKPFWNRMANQEPQP